MKRQQDQADRVWIINVGDPYITKAINELVERFWGRKTLILEDGHQAMQWVEDFRKGKYNSSIPELLICGHEMTGPNGVEVCSEARKIAALKDVPIFMIAHRFYPEEEEQIKKLVDGFIFTPFKIEQFKTAINQVLEKRQKKVGSK